MQKRDRIYLALIGDIVASRQLAERAHWQRELERLMARLNEAYSESLVSRFVITLGDEFQALLCDSRALAGLWRELAILRLPFSVRVGAGVGTITTDLKQDAVGMDGPAFHRAREAVEWLKTHGGLFYVETANSETNQVINTISTLCEAVRAGWTSHQHEAYAHLLRVTSQKELANQLHISPSAVSRMLKRMHVSAIAQGESTILQILDHLLTEERQA